jgi:hypothetical protein
MMSDLQYRRLIADLKADPQSVIDARLDEAVAEREMADLDDVIVRELAYRGRRDAVTEWLRRRDEPAVNPA